MEDLQDCELANSILRVYDLQGLIDDPYIPENVNMNSHILLPTGASNYPPRTHKHVNKQ